MAATQERNGKSVCLELMALKKLEKNYIDDIFSNLQKVHGPVSDLKGLIKLQKRMNNILARILVKTGQDLDLQSIKQQEAVEEIPQPPPSPEAENDKGGVNMLVDEA